MPAGYPVGCECDEAGDAPVCVDECDVEGCADEEGVDADGSFGSEDEELRLDARAQHLSAQL